MNNKHTVTTDWSIKKNKRDNDYILNLRLKPLLNIKSKINMLTMPGPAWIFEEQLIKNNPNTMFNILGVERDLINNAAGVTKAIELCNTFKNCRVIMAPPSLDFRRIITRDYSSKNPIFTKSVSWDVVYPDYMGTWNLNSLEDIEIIFNEENKLLNPLGIFISTYMLARGAHGVDGLWGETVELGNSEEANDIQIDDDRVYERFYVAGKQLSKHVYSLAKGIASFTRTIAKELNSDLHVYSPHIYYSSSTTGYEVPEGSFCFYKKS